MHSWFNKIPFVSKIYRPIWRGFSYWEEVVSKQYASQLQQAGSAISEFVLLASRNGSALTVLSDPSVSPAHGSLEADL